MIPNKGELKHYASEYYDPEKAHEYYMRTRELKGRKSSSNSDGSTSSNNSSNTSSSNSSGSSSGSSNKSGSYEEEYERYSFETSKKIAQLQRRLGRMSKEAKLLMQDEIYAEIDRLKEDQMNKKFELKAKYGKGSSGSSSGTGGPSSDFIEKNKANYVK